jgi:GntR family transcriptional regulator/MocR family aminotransferase
LDQVRESFAEFTRRSPGSQFKEWEILFANQKAYQFTRTDNPGFYAVYIPCYLGARNSFLFAGARVIHIPVDDEGFDLAGAIKRYRSARLVYATPSHQFPLGVTMSLSRRLALLEWAQRSDAFIVEDDYNSEYRYAGRPLASLQGLDKDGRVIYMFDVGNPDVVFIARDFA